MKANFLSEGFRGFYEGAMLIICSSISFELERFIPILDDRTCDYFLGSQVSSCSSRLLCWIGPKKTPHWYCPLWSTWSEDIFFPILSIWPVFIFNITKGFKRPELISKDHFLYKSAIWEHMGEGWFCLRLILVFDMYSMSASVHILRANKLHVTSYYMKLTFLKQCVVF